MKKIIQVLNNIVPLSKKDCDNFLNILTTTQLNKGEYWTENRKKNNKVGFLEEGYLRKFYLKEDDEVTDFFYFKNDFCADLPSIIGKSLSHASIIAMEQATLTIYATL